MAPPWRNRILCDRGISISERKSLSADSSISANSSPVNGSSSAETPQPFHSRTSSATCFFTSGGIGQGPAAKLKRFISASLQGLQPPCAPNTISVKVATDKTVLNRDDRKVMREHRNRSAVGASTKPRTFF
ncbi:protein of unknown function [Hyphomicrobium sp. 1Nfss2.1]